MSQPVPITFTEVLQLQKHGISPSSIGFSTVSLQSDKSVCVREKIDEKANVVIFDTANPAATMRKPITADSAIMNPVSKVIALKAGKNLQLFDLDNKQKVAAFTVVDEVVFWKWATDNVIAFVSGGHLYHWTILDNEQTKSPEKVFQLHSSLAQAQIINYHVDNSRKWCVLIGVNAANGKISGAMQLYSVDRNVTQPIAGHAATFAQFQLGDNPSPSNLFIFANRDDNGAKVHTIEVGGTPPGNQPFTKRVGDIFFQPDAANDFPIAIHADNQSGVFYVLTKAGYMYMYDIENASCFYATKISQEVLFASVPTSGYGFMAINRLGTLFAVRIDQDNIVNYLKTKGMENLAFRIIEKCGLPGSEAIYLQRFNQQFGQGNYEAAAKIAAKSPKNILRTAEIIRRFQSAPTAPGSASPLLHYFGCLLEMGTLNKEESIELCRPVVQQNKLNLIEKWLKENKLECSTELGDLVKALDINIALSIYLKGQATDRVMQCFGEMGQFDKIILYAQKVGVTPDYTNILGGMIKSNPDGSVEFAKQLISSDPPLVDITMVVDMYSSYNLVKQCTNFLLEALKDDKPEHGALQTRLLEMNLSNAPAVAEAIFSRKMFTHYDFSHIAGLCERCGLMQRALEHYTDIYDIKRAIVHTHLFNAEWLVMYFGNLSAEDSMACLKLLLESNSRQNLQLCSAIASKYSEQLTSNALMNLFESERCYEGLFLYLGKIVNYSEEPEVHFKYIQAACKVGQIKEAERICKESNFYDAERVKNFLKESRLQDHLPLVIVCDRHNFVQDLILYLYKQNAMKYIEMYVQKVNPTRLPAVVGGLLDLNCSDDFIRTMIIAVPDSYNMIELVEEVSKRNRIRLLLPVLENRIMGGSVDPSMHSAMAMVYIDSNINPEKFLRENKYYDPESVGKFCEKFDPNLAFISFSRGFCDEDVLRVCCENKLFKHLGRYLVSRMDEALWNKVLSDEFECRKHLVDQIVQCVLPETQDPEVVSFTVKAFMKNDLPNQLVDLLDQLVLNNTIFSNHKNIQNLLILTSIKADKARVMDYVTKLDNYDAIDIANIAIQNNLFEEALAIYKKSGHHQNVMGVLLTNIKDMVRAYEYAERVNQPAVWSILGRHQLSSDGLVKEALISYMKAEDPSNYRELTLAAKDSSNFEHLKLYLEMAKKSINDSFIDTQYAFCLIHLDQLDALDTFVKQSAHIDLVILGDECLDEGHYEAALILFLAASNYPKLAIVHMKKKDFTSAIDCARKANKITTWRLVCFGCLDQQEFTIAKLCTTYIVVNPDELSDVIHYYEKNAYFNELLEMLEAATSLERTHMGIFTELAICYAKYKQSKLREHVELFITRINIPKVIYSAEEFHLWAETVYLYEKYEEYDNAFRTMISHPAEAYHETKFKDIITKVGNVDLLYKAVNFYEAQHPLLLNELLNLISNKVDPVTIINSFRMTGNIPLIKGYLEFSQKLDSKIINETLNSQYIEDGQYEALMNSVAKYTNFDMIRLAEVLENHELVEFRRVSNALYKQCNRWNKSIELAKKDGLDSDAAIYAAESRDTVHAMDLLVYFTANKMKEATITLLYHCYDLLKPDDVLEHCWKNNMTDLSMPYFIQLLSDLIPKITELGGKVLEEEKATIKEQPSILLTNPLMLTGGPSFSPSHSPSSMGGFSGNQFGMSGSGFKPF